MQNLPTDIWMIVAQHLPPVPVEYIRLAAVSRAFYRVFMSDETWRRVNVYNVRENIAEHYLSLLYISDEDDIRIRVHIYRHIYGNWSWDSYSLRNKWLQDHPYDFFTIALSRWTMLKNCSDLKLPTGSLADCLMAETGDLSRITPGNIPSKKHVLSAILYGRPLSDFPAYKSDEGVVKLAVQVDEHALDDAPTSLQDDDEIVLTAVSNYPGALQYASDRLKASSNVVLAAVSFSGAAIKHAPAFHKITDNETEQVVRTAVSQDPSCIQWLDVETQGHPAVVEETFGFASRKEGLNRVLRQNLWSDKDLLNVKELRLQIKEDAT